MKARVAQNWQLHSQFGFLSIPIDAFIDGAEIRALPDHDEKLGWVRRSSHADGFYYTPTINSRPAQSFPLPPSHIISISHPVCAHPTIERDESFLAQALAFLFGTRLQLSCWRFEGRVPFDRQDSMLIEESTAIHFLQHMYLWWRKLSPVNRKRAVNILYSYTRAQSMEWEWDSFPWQYMIFDALWRLHRESNDLDLKGDGSHSSRIERICNFYEIPWSTETRDQLVKTRNVLFHEGLWENFPVGFSPPGGSGVQLPRHLERLNARLICAITGYHNKFVRSGWDFMGWQLFDQAPA